MLKEAIDDKDMTTQQTFGELSAEAVLKKMLHSQRY